MLRSPSLRSISRTLLVVVAATALVACGGSDDDADDGTTTTTTTIGGGDADGASACELIELADLTEVTGVVFDGAEPGEGSCTYTSTEGLAAIALNITDLDDIDPAQALEVASSSCDEGTRTDLELTDADGGFACTVQGVATVAATGEGVFAVLTGATVRDDVGDDQILRDLATILERAIRGR